MKSKGLDRKLILDVIWSLLPLEKKELALAAVIEKERERERERE